jgi:ribosome recycling factor
LIDELLQDAGERMARTVAATRSEFASVRTGRASPHLLDRVEVDYYGAKTPLRQLANISASEARLLTITPYDKSSIKAVERAIPELTEERRRELVKVVRGVAENGRVSVRNIRRECMHDLKELKQEGEAGSDEEHRAESELQRLTDARVKEIDDFLAGKEEEILEV